MAPRLRKTSSPHSPSFLSALSPSSAFFLSLLLFIVPACSLNHLSQTHPSVASFLLVYLVLVNCYTGILYSEDKSAARTAGWRISEKTLHICELAGGWPAALLSQVWHRHKISKSGYQEAFWVIVVVHELFWLYVMMDGAELRWLLGS